MSKSSEAFIESLAAEGRVLLLGGLAVIAHGLSRATKDVDVWLDPLSCPSEWTALLQRVLQRHCGAAPYDLKNKRVVQAGALEQVIDRDGVIRVVGLDRPVDIFRVPHNLQAADFPDVWQHARIQVGGARLPDEIDLLVTKEGTARPQDAADIAFLEERVRMRLSEQLRTCTFAEAHAIFQRYVDHETCRAALENPEEQVRELALSHLRRFAADGDPFARELLEGHGA